MWPRRLLKITKLKPDGAIANDLNVLSVRFFGRTRKFLDIGFLW